MTNNLIGFVYRLIMAITGKIRLCAFGKSIAEQNTKKKNENILKILINLRNHIYQ